MAVYELSILCEESEAEAWKAREVVGAVSLILSTVKGVWLPDGQL